MLFKVISDLHVDINKIFQREMQFDPNAFYLIAGDISGDRFQTTEFLVSKDIKGVFVEGNHFGYNWTTTSEEEDTKTLSNMYLKRTFGKDFQLVFLENDCVELGEYVIVGCTLYTDFNLFHNAPVHSWVAMEGMNDFRYVTVMDEDGTVRKVNADDYIKWFKKSVDYIDAVCEKYKDKKIIVLTHHTPSIKSISKEYVSDKLTPAYASELDQFILDRPQIKLWACGHCHHICTYNIGETKVVMNPFGYFNENSMDLGNYLGMDVEI